MWKFAITWVGRRIAETSKYIKKKILSIMAAVFFVGALNYITSSIQWDFMAKYGDSYPLLLREYGKQLYALQQNLHQFYENHTVIFYTMVASIVGYLTYTLRQLYTDEKESEKTQIARLKDKVVDYILQDLQNTHYLFVTQEDVDLMYELMTSNGSVNKYFKSAFRAYKQAEDRSFCELIIHNRDAQKLCSALVSAIQDD